MSFPLLSPLMGLVYSALSAVLLCWHSAWDALVGEAHPLGTSWSWVLGIVFLVLTVRILIAPLYVRQVRAQRAVQALQPRIRVLRDEHSGDPVRLRTELAALYRAEGVSPLAGVLPMVFQAPILLGLLHLLRHLRPTVTDEGTRTLYGWTATQFGEASHATLFGAPLAASLHADAAATGAVGTALIALMIVTTYLTSRQLIRRTGWSTDPVGRTVQRLTLYGIPLSLLVSGVVFPIGVVLYWAVQSLFALGQQTWILRRYPPPPPVDSPRPAVH